MSDLQAKHGSCMPCVRTKRKVATAVVVRAAAVTPIAHASNTPCGNYASTPLRLLNPRLLGDPGSSGADLDEDGIEEGELDDRGTLLALLLQAFEGTPHLVLEQCLKASASAVLQLWQSQGLRGCHQAC